MSILILGGHAKGHALFVPKGDVTKPTTVMLRRKFFDAHQDCTDMIFLDLCAGTGAMALEAASRGSREVICVEKNKSPAQMIKKNIKLITQKIPYARIDIHVSDAASYLAKYLNFISHWDEEKQEAVNIFFDPPYEDKKLYDATLEIYAKSKFKGTFWIESDRQKGILEDDVKKHGLHFSKVYKQGTSFIAKVEIS